MTHFLLKCLPFILLVTREIAASSCSCTCSGNGAGGSLAGRGGGGAGGGGGGGGGAGGHKGRADIGWSVIDMPLKQRIKKQCGGACDSSFNNTFRRCVSKVGGDIDDQLDKCGDECDAKNNMFTSCADKLLD